jgi:hypothetical protein
MPDPATAFTISSSGIRGKVIDAAGVVFNFRNVAGVVRCSLRRFG